MSPLAHVCHAAGIEIAGCDSKPGKTLDKLRVSGVSVEAELSEGMRRRARTYVFSSAIAKDNMALAAAHQDGRKCLHRSELLHLLLAGSKAITIAGTHGKTTTTAMITHVMAALGQDPSAIVGGVVRSLEASWRLGRGHCFVAEADESDGSFLRYSPQIAVVTNISSDHLDFYTNLHGVCTAFQSHVSHIQAGGWLIAGWDDNNVRHLDLPAEVNLLTFGTVLGCDVRAYEVLPGAGGIAFRAVVERTDISCKLQLPGMHNLQNALGTLAVCRALELDVVQAARALETFDGVGRRLELVFEGPDLTIFDDYAHNPGKIAAAVKSVAQAWPGMKLRVVFQPHRYSRLRTMYEEFAAAFVGAGEVIVTPIYAAGEPHDPSLDSEALAAEIEKRSKVSAIAKSSLSDTIDYLRSTSELSQIVLTLGAGDVNIVGQALKENALAKKDYRTASKATSTKA